MKGIDILLFIILGIVCISQIILYMTNKQLAKKRFKRLITYLILVFIAYKIINSILGDHFIIPLIPSLIYVPFLYLDYKEKNKG